MADSEIGKGTTFTLQSGILSACQLKVLRPEPRAHLMTNQKYVLLIEDNPDDVTLTQVAFKKAQSQIVGRGLGRSRSNGVSFCTADMLEETFLKTGSNPARFKTTFSKRSTSTQSHL